MSTITTKDSGPRPPIVVRNEYGWKAHPVVLRSTVLASDPPRSFTFVADSRGVHAERTFTLRPTPDGLGTVVVSYETQVGLLPWVGRAYLAPRLRAVNQAMFDDLARAVGNGSATPVTVAAESG